MTWPRRLATAALVFAAYAAFDRGYAALGHERPAPSRGRTLFLQGCATCHGIDGTGTGNGPSLRGVGAASADFYLSTGRMPLSRPGGNAVRKPPAYGRADIDALVAYVASLGPGPGVPAPDPKRADLVRGNELFQANCAACHGYAGRGGALSNGEEAADLTRADPRQVAEAIRIGPGTMPKFAEGSLDEQQVNDVTAYVEYLNHPDARGGAPLGFRGPLPEGFVAWFGGLAVMLLACLWIGVRR